MHYWIAAAFVLVLMSCKSEEKKSESKKPEPAKAEPAAVEPPAEPSAEPAAKPAPPEPELTGSPEELEIARKTAILEGRYEDALKICSAEDQNKLGEQAVLSCVLSACRLQNSEKAQEWGKLLKGPLKKQAQTVCKTSNIPI